MGRSVFNFVAKFRAKREREARTKAARSLASIRPADQKARQDAMTARLKQELGRA